MELLIKTFIEKALDKKADILFVVTPFASLKFPSLGLHILQSIAAGKGFSSNVLYLNILLASCIGRKYYDSISEQTRISMLGERLFSRSAYGVRPLGESIQVLMDPLIYFSGNIGKIRDLISCFFANEAAVNGEEIIRLETLCYDFMDYCIKSISKFNFKIAGCSTMFQQTNSSVAILNRLKKQNNSIITLIGGANCEAKMAEGVATLSENIDYIFSGESEKSFNSFLSSFLDDELPANRILYGEPLDDFGSYNALQYEDFFRQLKYMPETELPGDIALLLESSRGCWWGTKKKCTFCGINKDREYYRQKDPDKFLKEFITITGKYPGVRIQMTDNIMPYQYFNSFLPLLIQRGNQVPLFYEQKANLNFTKLVKLKNAGIKSIQPGIESFSTAMLKLLHKGVQGWQNILLLRNARALGIDVHWNLLWGAPGDEEVYYKQINEILPLLYHLQPPVNFSHINIHRFSEYFENPVQYKIKNIVPSAIYRNVFHPAADVALLAYNFFGEYECEAYANIGLIKNIYEIVNNWQRLWADSIPVLSATEFLDGYLIYDTRPVSTTRHMVLDHQTISEIMQYGKYTASVIQKMSLDYKWAIVIDSRYIPLITAQEDLMLRFNPASHSEI